jgi:hypothetical protein
MFDKIPIQNALKQGCLVIIAFYLWFGIANAKGQDNLE